MKAISFSQHSLGYFFIFLMSLLVFGFSNLVSKNLYFWFFGSFCNIKFFNIFMMKITFNYDIFVATPLWGKCEDDTCTPKSGDLKSSRTLETSELDCRGQNTSPWGVIYTVGKVLKSRCQKWPCRSHLDICNTSYSQKKGRESNWQFDSWPLKVGNWPDPSVCMWSATHRRKAVEENYKFASNLISIRGLSWELWAPKVPGV
jgi:hypothetical protein